jgi:hypothetical protein
MGILVGGRPLYDGGKGIKCDLLVFWIFYVFLFVRSGMGFASQNFPGRGSSFTYCTHSIKIGFYYYC